MGNITALSRNGHRNVEASNFGVMDDLTYSYDNGNKLMRISDAATIDQFGFKDDVVGSTPDTANDYTYDVNGNMLTDINKGITSNILYNHLSLPTQINVKGQVINYTYDAAGNKLKKVTNGVTTEYAGNYRYVGGELKDFKHPEGYVKNDGGTFNYVYSYTDHLGNVRLNYADLNNDGVIQAATEILDEKNYYPFGGTHEGYNTAINGVYYPFGYNGKEENDENGLATLDFGARNYDKWAGRWMNLDPLADQMRRHSPYNYAFDNPVYFIDPDGMAPVGQEDCCGPGTPTGTAQTVIKATNYIARKVTQAYRSFMGLPAINLEGGHVDKAGSGVVISNTPHVGDSGQSIAEHPGENIIVPHDVINTVKTVGKMGKNPKMGDGMTNAVSKTKNAASNMSKNVKDFQKGMKNAKKFVKVVENTMNVSNFDKDTTFTTTYANGIVEASATYGRTGVKTDTVTVPKSKVDSVLTSVKQKDAAALKNLENRMDKIANGNN
jgi:RHS repeat-associated protein